MRITTVARQAVCHNGSPDLTRRSAVASKVDPKVLWKTPGRQPNGLQATPDGLWVIDQIDPNDIYLLSYEGKELKKIPTRAKHASGITIDPKGNIWVASTFGYELICF